MNDAGKVAFTPKGDYSSAVTYEYLDTVVYNGNAYAALKTTTGNAPTDADTDENWKLLARGGTSVPVATEEVAGIVKASSDIGVSDTGSMVLKTDYTEQESLTELTGGETRSIFFGKIAKAVSSLISHVTTAATTSDLGHVKLTNSISSTSTTTAAVPANVKTAYDKAAAALPKANVSQSSAITTTGTYALDAVEKNASINGTMANQIGKKVNTSDIINNLTSTATNKPLSAAQGTILKAAIDTLNNKTGNVGQALKMNGYANKNLVYSNYDFGIYYVVGDEEGLPLKGYSGFMITIKFLNSRIVKILILINTYTYVLGQDNDGTVLGGWTRLNN